MLWHKLWRDILQNRGANLACITVIAIGIMTFNAFHMAVDNLDYARLRFYNECNFGDGFATVKEMPINRLTLLEEIPGIAQVQGNLRQDVTVYMPQWGQNLTLRLVGVDPEDHLAINRVIQDLGPGIKRGSPEVLLGRGFMEAHQIVAGDQVDIILAGKKHSLTVAGTGQSPEFIYLMLDAGSLFSDAATFDVAFLDVLAIEDLLNKQGIVNEISFNLKPGFRFENVEFQIEEILEPYGLINLVAAKDQASNFMTTQEIDGVRMMASSLPGMFIVIAVFILYLMLRRMVEQQRTQIGTMKAFGVSSAEVIGHYSWYGGCLGLAGGIIGTVLGILLSDAMTQMYGQYFHLPNLTNQISWHYSIQGMLVAILPSMAAAFIGARSVLKLTPAQAMQPPAPQKIRKSIFERMKLFWSSLGMLGRMALRNISRNLGRSIFTMVGTMFAFAILWVVFSFNLMIDLMIMNQVNQAQKYDFKVVLNQPQDTKAVLNSMQSLEGIDLVEPLLQAPVTLRSDQYSYDTLITGLQDESRLYGILDKGDQLLANPEEGILLSHQVAKKLQVKPGQLIYVESSSLKEPTQVYVAGIVEQYLGVENYMSLENLNHLLKLGNGISTVLVKTSGSEEIKNNLEEKLLLAAGVAGVENKEAVLKMYKKMMDPMAASIYGMVLVGVVTTFAVIYASATVSLSERQREISSSKVLGMTDFEIILTLAIENSILSIGGIIIGLPFTKWLMLIMQQSYETELYSLPTKLDPLGFINSIWAVCLALFIALLSIKRKISKLEIVEVLKTRD